MAIYSLDLTQRPPRSPRVTLGGYGVLPRVLDKCRAVIAGKQGEYEFNCPLDQRFFAFAGVDAEAFKKEVAAGKSDGEMLAWVNANSSTKPTAPDAAAWAQFMNNRAPGDPGSRSYFNDLHTKIAPNRDDIVSWADLLDVDDYVSYGGKP